MADSTAKSRSSPAAARGWARRSAPATPRRAPGSSSPISISRRRRRSPSEIAAAGERGVRRRRSMCATRRRRRRWSMPPSRRFGGLDILVNNAGVGKIIPFLETTEEDWDFMFDVNCKGLLWCSQAAARQMIEQGRGGKIVNLASQAGRRGEALVLAYCASKACVISMTQSMALALAPHKINVNAHRAGDRRYPVLGRGRQAVRRSCSNLGDRRAEADVRRDRSRSAASSNRRTSPAPRSSSPRPIPTT